MGKTRHARNLERRMLYSFPIREMFFDRSLTMASIPVHQLLSAPGSRRGSNVSSVGGASGGATPPQQPLMSPRVLSMRKLDAQSKLRYILLINPISNGLSRASFYVSLFSG